jgi:hypothetical protein
MVVGIAHLGAKRDGGRMTLPPDEPHSRTRPHSRSWIESGYEHPWLVATGMALIFGVFGPALGYFTHNDSLAEALLHGAILIPLPFVIVPTVFRYLKRRRDRGNDAEGGSYAGPEEH